MNSKSIFCALDGQLSNERKRTGETFCQFIHQCWEHEVLQRKCSLKYNLAPYVPTGRVMWKHSLSQPPPIQQEWRREEEHLYESYSTYRWRTPFKVFIVFSGEMLLYIHIFLSLRPIHKQPFNNSFYYRMHTKLNVFFIDIHQYFGSKCLWYMSLLLFPPAPCLSVSFCVCLLVGRSVCLSVSFSNIHILDFEFTEK